MTVEGASVVVTMDGGGVAVAVCVRVAVTVITEDDTSAACTEGFGVGIAWTGAGVSDNSEGRGETTVPDGGDKLSGFGVGPAIEEVDVAVNVGVEFEPKSKVDVARTSTCEVTTFVTQTTCVALPGGESRGRVRVGPADKRRNPTMAIKTISRHGVRN